jgi:hypothetical protein
MDSLGDIFDLLVQVNDRPDHYRPFANSHTILWTTYETFDDQLELELVTFKRALRHEMDEVTSSDN